MYKLIYLALFVTVLSGCSTTTSTKDTSWGLYVSNSAAKCHLCKSLEQPGMY